MIISLNRAVTSVLRKSDNLDQLPGVDSPSTEQINVAQKEEYIKNTPLFSELAEDQRQAICAAMRFETHRSDQPLFEEGEMSAALYLVENGWVDLYRAGDDSAIRNAGPGSLLGEVDFLLGRPYMATARASGDVAVWKLNNRALSELIAEQPRIGLSLGLALGTGVAQAMKPLADHLAEIPLLCDLSEDERYAVAQRLSPHRYRPRQTIYRSGAPPVGIFIIEQGSVWLLGDTVNDSIEVVAGEIFGEGAVICEAPHTRTAQAATEVVVWQLSPADFTILARVHPYIKLSLGQNLQHHLTEALTIASLIVDREIDELNVVAGDQSNFVKKLHQVSQTLAWLKSHPALF